jgi:RNA polymerase sigma-70 factor (ECF subfamily)
MKFDKISDEALALHIQENSGEGIEELIERYQEPLLRYAQRLINDPEASEDAIQNTFVSAYQNINSYNPRRPFSSWIYRIAHNKAINEVRNSKPKVSLEEATEIPDPEDAETLAGKLDDKALRKLLEKHLESLPVKYREPLILRYFEEQSYDEISDILRIPKNTVGVRIRRGLEKLKIKVDINAKEYL